MDCQTVYAPAKVNLCLHVEARRGDGYHELCMIMQKVSLCDELTVTVSEGEGVELVCDQVPLADGEDNLVVRASRLVLEEAQRRVRVDLRLTKNIPVAAGLGGGSSDAASALLTLNGMLGNPVALPRLHELALQLGADVPFFLQDDTVWARGVGERLTPVCIAADYVLLLVNPGVPVSTAAVYQGLTQDDFSCCTPVERIDDRAALCRMLHNDLERVAITHQPVIEKVKKRVASCGAEGVLMSGSGATVFGVFAHKKNADKAAERLRSQQGWRCEVVSPL
ncbi:4-(cytidine 5'-diphospho)-2-C-methyl-D-erythritol kinase [uncultured Desulfuromonas sp.]|uniref:4-(cytidine 5'-diphospho)-2-C-methyl-D-erythritol kinase n=1 Tax=uncultured Desulfuromonas sp. TaxID=181013 RepID=UPI002AAC2E9A|nr:4-(cytidine 5'-diphospho)-2-C-methyl-D-erythritol kinase [uncultured Desulfuromonas sp.]